MAAPESRLEYIEKQIVGLEKDAAGAFKIADKFEITLDKITEATNSIRQLLAVHDSQIHRQHETDLDLYATLESNKKENLHQHRDIVDLIDKGMRSVSDQIKALDIDVSSKFENTTLISADHDRRIRGLERITFIGLGLAMLAGLIIDKVPFDKLF